MKTAISLSDQLFAKAEKFAKRTGKSRSQLYAEALAEYVARHSDESVTETMNAVCEKMGSADTKFPRTAARRVFKKEAW